MWRVSLAVLTVGGLTCICAGAVWEHLQQPMVWAPELGGDPVAREQPPAGVVPSAPAPPIGKPPSASSARTPTERGGRAGHAGLAASPELLSLPAQQIQAPIVAIGQQSQSLDLPADPHVVGWWAAGAAPGDAAGNAVLAGHVDSATHGLGSLAALVHLRLGDDVTVSDAAGVAHQYTVTSRRTYAKVDLPSRRLFDREGPPRLVMITCGGAFDARSSHYEDNIVVVAAPSDQVRPVSSATAPASLRPAGSAAS